MRVSGSSGERWRASKERCNSTTAERNDRKTKVQPISRIAAVLIDARPDDTLFHFPTHPRTGNARGRWEKRKKTDTTAFTAALSFLCAYEHPRDASVFPSRCLSRLAARHLATRQRVDGIFRLRFPSLFRFAPPSPERSFLPSRHSDRRAGFSRPRPLLPTPSHLPLLPVPSDFAPPRLSSNVQLEAPRAVGRQP